MNQDKSGIVHHIKTESGAFDIEAMLVEMGEDLLVSVTGGDTPHIGAVAMSQPRPSLKDPKQISATASVFTYVGHKEDELVKAMAETLSGRLNRKVVVAAGIHWDNISEDGIRQVMNNSRELIDRILNFISTVSP